MGCVVSLSPSSWTRSSGLAPTTSKSGNAGEEEVRRRVDPAEASIQADAVELPARGGIDGQVERLPAGEHDLDRLARRDGVLRDFHRMHVFVAAEARLDGGGRGGRTVPAVRTPTDPRTTAGPDELGRRGPGGALEGLEDGRFRDPVAALEVRRVGVQRRDRREGVGQVVEDDDEVRLDEGGRRHAGRVRLGQRHGRLEDRDRVVGKGPHGAAGEARHALARTDASSRDEGPDCLQGVECLRIMDGQIRRVVAHAHGAVLDPGTAVPDLE